MKCELLVPHYPVIPIFFFAFCGLPPKGWLFSYFMLSYAPIFWLSRYSTRMLWCFEHELKQVCLLLAYYFSIKVWNNWFHWAELSISISMKKFRNFRFSDEKFYQEVIRQSNYTMLRMQMSFLNAQPFRQKKIFIIVFSLPRFFFLLILYRFGAT